MNDENTKDVQNIQVECTWGECADVLVCGTIPIFNLCPVTDQDRFKDGLSRDWQLDLTADEAINMGQELIRQGMRASELEKQYSIEMGVDNQ